MSLCGGVGQWIGLAATTVPQARVADFEVEGESGAGLRIGIPLDGVASSSADDFGMLLVRAAEHVSDSRLASIHDGDCSRILLGLLVRR